MGEEFDYNSIDVDVNEDMVQVTLSRPEIHNAFDDVFVSELKDCFDRLSEMEDVRAVVLTGEGKSFCAGADLNWMRRMADYDESENYRDSLELAGMFKSIHSCSKPVLGLINGSAFGGGVGLVACCDYVVCAPDALLSLSEVNLGIAPSVISPYILARVSEAKARWLFISGERVSAEEAHRIGLVDAVADGEQAWDIIRTKIKFLRSSGPIAIAKNKELVELNKTVSGDELTKKTAAFIAELRVSDEGQEGLTAFLEKRKPAWREK